jgi:hypothetical protein
LSRWRSSALACSRRRASWAFFSAGTLKIESQTVVSSRVCPRE